MVRFASIFGGGPQHMMVMQKKNHKIDEGQGLLHNPAPPMTLEYCAAALLADRLTRWFSVTCNFLQKKVDTIVSAQYD
jgi:hypothetical protein